MSFLNFFKILIYQILIVLSSENYAKNHMKQLKVSFQMHTQFLHNA